MLSLAKNQNWKPAPVLSLGQTQLPKQTGDLSNSERFEQGLLNVGLGLGAGAVLGSVVNSFSAQKPSVLAASIVSGLGLIMSLTAVTLVSDLDYARTVQFASGVITGFGGSQVIKSTLKTA